MLSSSRFPCRQRPRPRLAFTLVEATVAMAITLIAASTLLLAIESTITSGDDALDKVIAAGMAEQLLEEVRHTHYMSPGSSPTQLPFGPNAAELAGPGWNLYNDTDDFDQMVASPVHDRYGKPLGSGDDANGLRHTAFRLPGSTLALWRQKVEVYFVNAANLSQRLTGSATSSYRAVEVTIERADAAGVYRKLAVRRFVCAYVPPGS